MVYLYEFLRWFLLLIYNHKSIILAVATAIVFIIGFIIKNPELLFYTKNIILKIKNYTKEKISSIKNYITSKFEKKK